MADAGQEIQLQCSPVRRAMESNDYEQTIAEAEVLSFPLASPKKMERPVTPTTRPALVSHPPAAKTAPRRRSVRGGSGRVRPILLQNNGNKSLLDVSCDASYDCASTTRDSSFDCHQHHHDSTNLTSLLGLSAINIDSDLYHQYQVTNDDDNDNEDNEKKHLHLLDQDEDIIVPKILFPEEMMHGASGPMDGDLADDDFHGDDEDDDASDVFDDDNDDVEYSHSDYLNANHSSAHGATDQSSPFKDLTNIGGGGKNQQKLKEVDVTEATASLSASFFHNLSSTFADSIFCGGAGAVNSLSVDHTPRASPVRCRMIPRASPSSGRSAAATPHRHHHLPRPSPSRSVILSTPLRTETPSRFAATSDTGDNANRSTLSEMEDALREHFRRLDCYANTGTPIRTPEKCSEETDLCDTEDKAITVTPQKQQLMELYENRTDAHMFHSTMTRNKYCNRAAQPVRFQAERIHSLYFHGTLPSYGEASLGQLEMAADATLSSRLKRVDHIEKNDEPSFELSRASSFNDLSLQNENITSCRVLNDNEEQDADLSTLIGCIEPISMLHGDIEHGLDQTKANIPNDDVCYDSDPGGIEQMLARENNFHARSEQRDDCDGRAGMRRRRRKLKSSIAIVQVRFCFLLSFLLSRTYIFSCLYVNAPHCTKLIPFCAFMSRTANNERKNFPHMAPRDKPQWF